MEGYQMVFAQGEELDVSDDDQLVCILIEDSLERKKNLIIEKQMLNYGELQ